ncbi:MAG: sigma-54-dependent Fis family transcriptional regulator [Planctomycetes bacterium]|nr:sigma-54-dependent Fis family transcriptional regulator [Planctomycetota bacterium]
MNKVNKKKIKVLLVEDNRLDILSTRKMLTGWKDSPFEVECASLLSEAIERLEKERFDAVLLDLGLPDSFGLETFTSMRAQAAHVPIVVLTGQDDEELSMNALQHGAQDYLIKGDINREALRRCLRYAIERKQNEEALWIRNRIIESSINPIAITDLQGKLTYVNNAFLELWTYQSADDVIGKAVKEFWDKKSEALSITEAVCSEGSWVGKIHSRRKDDGKLDLQLSAFIVKEKDKSSESLCMVFSFVDITELTHLRRRLKTEQSFAGLIGHDKQMLELFDTIREVAQVNIPVLIQGQSGTGKELVAIAIHNESSLVDKPFVPVNCGALPEGVLESELFGHVKGAFTGAVCDRKGRFELADGGTIFLDEIGDIPAPMQVKLLRVLQESTFQRVGGEETIKVDVRVISATNKNLTEEVSAGRFREDLFYRLCVVPVYLPPLCERRNDIPLLAEHLLKKALTEMSRQDVTLSSEAVDVMMDYEWPGNVRELENALQYALVKCRDNVLMPEHLPLNIHKTDVPGQPCPPKKTRKKRKHKLNTEKVWQALAETGGNKIEASQKLGVSRATLYRFIEESEKTGKITAI